MRPEVVPLIQALPDRKFAVLDATVADIVQRIKIDTSAGSFVPDAVTAKAGSPIELEFPPGGSGCSASITFPTTAPLR